MEERSKAQFVSEVLATLQLLSPGRAFDFNGVDFSVRFGDGTAVQLGNLFQAWLASGPSQRQLLLRNIADVARANEAPVPERFADVADRLFPRLRDLASQSLAGLALELEGKQMATSVEKRLGNHLRVGVVYDGDGFIADVTSDHLDRWECSPDQLFDIAAANLRRYAQTTFRSPSPGVFVASGRDPYEAARCVLPEISQLPVRGKPLAFAVHRELLIVTGDEDRDALRFVGELIESEWQRPYGISVVPLRFARGEWRTHRLAGSAEAIRRLQNLSVTESANLYQQQAGVLERLTQSRGEATFVAPFKVVEEEGDGALDSYCTWSEGMTSLLPETGRIGFVRPPDVATARTALGKLLARKKAWAAMARFEDVVRVVGHRMQRVEMYPVRYRVDSFPSKRELAEMGAVEIPLEA